MLTPGKTELLLILGIVVLELLIVSPTYYLAKKKNLRVGWNIFWTLLFGPFWWIVMLFRKKKIKVDN